MNTDWHDLIQRHIAGLTTEEENALLHESLKRDDAVARLYLRYMNLDVALEAHAGSQAAVAEMLEQQNQVEAKHSTRWLSWRPLAAAAILVLGGFAAMQWMRPAAEPREIALAKRESTGADMLPVAAAHQAAAMPARVAVPANLATAEADAEPVDFAAQVLPVLESRCFKCHSSEVEKPKGDVKLDDAASVTAMFTGEEKFIVPGKPEESRLLELITLPAGDEDVMPPAKESSPVAKQQVQVIRAWIAQGAKLGTWQRHERQQFARVTLTREQARDTQAMARRLDELWLAALAKHNAQPNPPASDEVFLRRIYMDLIGRNPTLAEARRFLEETAANKRARLIDELLASPGYVSRAFNYWAESLRAQTAMTRVNGSDFHAWFKQQLRDNTPYDQIVRTMLTAEGRYLENPATGYYLRDEDNKLAGVEANAELFLGTKIDCAQCHDHPFDRWTRHDYHAFAAYTLGMSNFVPKNAAMPHQNMEVLWKQQGAMNDYLKRLSMAREPFPDSDEGKRQAREAMAKVPPPLLDGLSPELLQMIEQRAQRNGLDFGITIYKTLVNVEKQINAPGKPWSKYYRSNFPKDYQYPDGKAGEAITPRPLYGAARKPESAAQLAPVFAEWLTAPENDRFALVLANRLWKWMFGSALCGPPREVRPVEKSADAALALHLEALVRGSGFDLKQMLRILANTRAYQSVAVNAPSNDEKPAVSPGPLLRRLTAEQIWDSLITLMDESPDSEVSTAAVDRSHYHALTATRTPEDFWRIVIAELDRRLAAGDTFTAGNIRNKKVKVTGFDADALRRASEIQQPAPDGHFLRVFGQSNRELMDNSWTAPTIPQTLTLMNGSLLGQITAPESALQKAVASLTQPEQQIEALFLAVLARRPTDEERRAVLASGTAPTDLTWTLLNTRHFLFLQ